MTKVTDEMLMAYVDGELDRTAAEDVRRAAESDATLARRANAFRATRGMAKNAYASIKSEPVPEKLIAAVLGGGNSNVVPLRRTWTRTWTRTLATRAALPLAASIALLAGLGGYWIALQSPPGGDDLFGGRAIAQALGQTPSGVERTLRTAGGEARLRTLATYRVEGGVCRTFEVASGSHDVVRGVGCARGSDWRVDVAVAAGGSDSFPPASSGAPAAVDAYLDALDAEGPLSAEEEEALAKGAR